MDVCKKALFNFLNHKHSLNSRDFDEFVLKSVELNYIPQIIDMFKYHYCFKYYPHPYVSSKYLVNRRINPGTSKRV